LKANYEVANTWLQNDSNWVSNANNLYTLQKYMKRDFWRFGEWAVTFAGDKIDTWMPLLNSNIESAIASNTTISNLWDGYVATPSNGELPLSSEIDSRFFETKGKHGHHKGKNDTEWKDDIDWAKCKTMNKTSEEFDKECGAKGNQWKGGKEVIEGKWDCCMKNETMKNGTMMMGKDEWDQFDKTKDEWNNMTDEEKQAYKDSFKSEHKDKFLNVLEKGELKPKRKQCRCGKPGEGKPGGINGQGKPNEQGYPES
jgi:hypothetical protein